MSLHNKSQKAATKKAIYDEIAQMIKEKLNETTWQHTMMNDWEPPLYLGKVYFTWEWSRPSSFFRWLFDHTYAPFFAQKRIVRANRVHVHCSKKMLEQMMTEFKSEYPPIWYSGPRATQYELSNVDMEYSDAFFDMIKPDIKEVGINKSLPDSTFNWLRVGEWKCVGWEIAHADSE